MYQSSVVGDNSDIMGDLAIDVRSNLLDVQFHGLEFQTLFGFNHAHPFYISWPSVAKKRLAKGLAVSGIDKACLGAVCQHSSTSRGRDVVGNFV